MKTIKAWAECAFYILAVIGVADMAAQAASNGCTKPIHAAIEWTTGIKPATPKGAHCATITMEDE